MGLYSQNSLSGPHISNIDMRRRSVDSIDETIRDGRGSIDYGRESIIDQSDIAEILKRRKLTRTGRVRKRLDILLHTHFALIIVTILSSLDAVCVIGQIICDILIMSDKLSKYDDLHDRAVPLMFDLLPDYLNKSIHGKYDFEKIVGHLEAENTHQGSTNTTHNAHTGSHRGLFGRALLSMAENGLGVLHHRVRRASGGDSNGEEHAEHDLLHELTHSFHIGSMVILSVLLVEVFFKIFAMWKHFLNHKLEIFDAFVIIVSWSLDVAFWEGIWARPGQEGSTLLIFILPWRVIRIVNSFVLVIQEKDMVILKVVKQRLRISLRKEKEYSAKLDKYRLEVKNLQGLCRKCGADENAILACCPAGRRRRSSLFQSLTSLASVALVSAMGSSPKAEPEEDSDDDIGQDNKNPKILSRIDSKESGINVKFDISPDNDSTNGESAHSNKAFRYDSEAITKLNGKPPNEGFHTRL